MSLLSRKSIKKAYLLYVWIHGHFRNILLSLTKDNSSPFRPTVDLKDISDNCWSLRPMALDSQMLQEKKRQNIYFIKSYLLKKLRMQARLAEYVPGINLVLSQIPGTAQPRTGDTYLTNNLKANSLRLKRCPKQTEDLRM